MHWRPKDYWKAGTQVDVRADLLGVAYGGGAWGREDLTTSFRIGRSQIVRADVNMRQAKVELDRAKPLADKGVIGVAELDSTRSKYDQAVKLGLEIVEEDEFLRRLGR